MTVEQMSWWMYAIQLTPRVLAGLTCETIVSVAQCPGPVVSKRLPSLWGFYLSVSSES